MPLRLIEIVLPADSSGALEDFPHSDHVLSRWEDHLADDNLLVRMLVDAENTEVMLDHLQKRCEQIDGFRVLLLPVEATLPRPEQPESKQAPADKKSAERISREELYDDVVQSSRISRVFVAQVILATLVAAVGLMRNDTAIIIGAMVIAPLLGPNVSLCLATALGDMQLALQSLRTNALGLAVTFVGSLMIGFSFPIDPAIDAIESRTQVSGGDVILALASGCAGVLAFTTGAPSALIGVMVAVALLPPFVVFGLMLTTGDFSAAVGALLLVSTNVICVNLAGVVTFVVQGIRPRTWWESERAKKATRAAISAWSILLILLLGLIALASRV